MKSRIVVLSGVVAAIAFPFASSAQVPQLTREQMESAQTDGFGARRGKKKDDDWLEPQRMREEFGRRTSDTGSATPASRGGTDSPSATTPSASPQPTTGAGAGAVGGTSGRSGIVTGLGGPGPSGNSGRGNGHGPRGLVTGAGHGGGPGSGKGIVNAAGAAPATAGSAGRPAGAGIVTAGGAVVAPSVAGAAKPGAGIVTGAGGPPGHANGQGHGRGGKR